MPDRPCTCPPTDGEWCPRHGHGPAGPQHTDGYRSRPWHWAVVAAVLGVLLLAAAACTDATATPTPSPAPPAEGAAGGTTGGDR